MSTRTPQLFTRGAPLWLRQSLYLLLALFAIVVDNHFHQLNALRNLVYITLQPFQAVANLPSSLISHTTNLFSNQLELAAENKRLKLELLKANISIQDKELLSKKNAELEALVGIKGRYNSVMQISQTLYAVHNPFHEKLMIDGGTSQHYLVGSPVVTSAGLIGQITQLFPHSSEVTLISDKNLSVPIENLRTGYRSFTEGEGVNDLFDVMYVPITSDFKVGDEIVSSGLGGLYPAGIPVGQVVSVTRENNSAYFKIQCKTNHVMRSGHYLAILSPVSDTELAEKIKPLQEVPSSLDKKKNTKKKN
ncbi:MAG: rod shape-determining protein MreC [Betaproteobacteria bacterium]|uniref:rod shape-determining protein MreC n=1 Tax=Ferrovum sp. PN-J185 TaxID=1356306 RepID=UPI000793A156|nr:rod shape-determining protein MreC [Ferrovum sp. PN-J185]KXW55613.1 cell shape-determining protein MreC [Ferrovum sp. PN-J185]MDE1891176.1 rod shape-determining protein MreC [Betaproteobacteria bacterium]MDE2056216.1 rod shape-determining protein MreC [Betaproteobacteria bacterium]